MSRFFYRYSPIVTRGLEREALKLARSQAIGLTEAKAEVLKERLLEVVREHPVAQEILNQTEPSDYVPSQSGTATLFGYIGFDAGSDPIGDLIDFLEKNIQITTPTSLLIGRRIVTNLRIPTKDDFDRDGRFTHARLGISWMDALERGLVDYSNAQFFIQKKSKNSASGLGIQIENRTRPSVGRIQFLSEIFKDFRKQFGGQ